MSSRALSLATVLLLMGFGATDTVLAQATNLEAGKAPSQLFAQTCNACHKSPRGLLKTVAPGSLPGFLRQHYTTSSDMASVLASYLVSNGATDTRYQAKDGKDKKDGAKEKEANTAPEHQGRRQRSQDSAKSEGEAAAPVAEGARQKRAARPAEEGAKEGVKPEGQTAPEGRKGKRRSRPGTEEAPKVDAAAPVKDDKSEPKPEPKPEPNAAKVEPGRDEAKPESKPAEKPEAKPDSARVEPRGSDTPALRPDPVPQVTPAAPAAGKPADAKPADEAPKPAASSEPAAKPSEPAPPAAAAAPPPAESSGPPAAPISR